MRIFQEKCLSLGVPPGPLVAELKSGRDVVLDDGTLVRSSDVVEDSTNADQVWRLLAAVGLGALAPILSHAVGPEAFSDKTTCWWWHVPTSMVAFKVGILLCLDIAINPGTLQMLLASGCGTAVSSHLAIRGHGF